MKECILQQKDSTCFPTIAVTMENGPPRQHHMGVPCLTIVQLVWTNKQMTRVDTDYKLQQLDNANCTIITATVNNGATGNLTQTYFTLDQVKLHGLSSCHHS